MPKSLIATGLSPNFFAEDVRLASKLLLQPWTWRAPPGLLQSQNKGENKERFLVESGRSAFLLLLKSFEVGKGDEVLIQAFTCVAVPNPIKWAGATPVYVDIDKSTLNMDPVDLEKKITNRSKVVVVQHTFGLPAAMNRIFEIARKHNLLVIEDCAHSLGSALSVGAEQDGQKVGELGVASFYSFGRDKVISSVVGGEVMVNVKSQKPKTKIAQFHDQLDTPPVSWTVRQLLHPVTSSIILKTYPYVIGKALHFVLQKLNITMRANTQGEKLAGEQPRWVPSKMPQALYQLLQQQERRLHEFNQRRSEIAQRYHKAGIGSVQPQVKGRIWLRYPLLVKNPQSLHQKAKQRNIILGDWYDTVVAPKEVDLTAARYKLGSCPVAEEISKHIINLPTYPRMKDEEVERVIEVVGEISNS